MPPKKDTSQTKNKDKNEKAKDGKRKPKVLPKGTGMGGTIGLAEKKVKSCTVPCVKSFSRPPACCPQEIGCPMPVCQPTAPTACPISLCSPPPCCGPNYS